MLANTPRRARHSTLVQQRHNHALVRPTQPRQLLPRSCKPQPQPARSCTPCPGWAPRRENHLLCQGAETGGALSAPGMGQQAVPHCCRGPVWPSSAPEGLSKDLDGGAGLDGGALQAGAVGHGGRGRISATRRGGGCGNAAATACAFQRQPCLALGMGLPFPSLPCSTPHSTQLHHTGPTPARHAAAAKFSWSYKQRTPAPPGAP